jgi:formylglycine-generating enzyme required for sulfatase activity
MVHVPGGTFTMGASRVSPKNDPARRTVATFDLDVNEVTASDYATCVSRGLCTAGTVEQPTCNYGHTDRANHPMNCVDWSQASVYCHAVGKRLPTEEEWEYASRAGAEERAYPWGSAEPAQQLCWSGITKRDGTCPVRSFPPGAYGLYDMAGNVSEWTSSPSAADQRDTRVYRGGGWSDARALDLQGAFRDAHAPTNKDSDLGFRCAR